MDEATNYYLARETYARAIGKHVIFLHLPTHRYLSVDCGVQPAILEGLKTGSHRDDGAFAIARGDEAHAAELLSQLIKAGLVLRTIPSELTPRSNLVPPQRSLVSLPSPLTERLPISAIVRFVVSYVSVRLELRTKGLEKLIHRMRQSKTPDINGTDLVAAARAVRWFCRIRPWFFTAHENCLLDALVLSKFMRRSGHRATFVIGVFPMPFSAHASSQIDDCLLDDTVESARMYSALLAA